MSTADSNPSFGVARKPEPFTFAAITTKNLIRGELVQFYVDSHGKITSAQLEFIQPMTPRILKKPADA